MLAVVGLPVLLPIVALLQLLFPGLLRDQWRQYRFLVQVLLTQSTLIFVQWALLRWVFDERTWWLSDQALWIALVLVALIGAVLAVLKRDRGGDGVDPASKAPTSLEYWAIGIMAAVGLGWAGYSALSGGSPWDQMAVVTAGALAGLAHLAYRGGRSAATQPRRAFVTTELAFIWTQVAVGVLLGAYLYQDQANQVASEVRSDWPTFRGNPARTGAASDADAGPLKPQVLWTFDAKERKGSVAMHSSPTVVDGKVYVGAMQTLLGSAQGCVYCIHAGNGKLQNEQQQSLQPGERIWRFSAGGTMKAVFSSPTVLGGKVYFGEGYHQDQKCRMFCLDARNADAPLWTFSTASHVESSPTMYENRIYFGAGDDGLFCVQAADREELKAGSVVWQFKQLHVDSSPLVVDNRLFAGSVAGDVYTELDAVSLDAGSGATLWRVRSPLPLPSAPAFADERVFFALGNGKLTEDADQPDGRLWCLNAETGEQLWEYRAGSSVLGSPAAANSRVYFCSRDQHCYALNAADGKLAWKRDLGEPIVASPVVTRDTVYALTVGGVLYCLSANDGALLWQLDATKNSSDDAFASPTLVDGRLYVASGGKLFCVGDLP